MQEDYKRVGGAHVDYLEKVEQTEMEEQEAWMGQVDQTWREVRKEFKKVKNTRWEQNLEKHNKSRREDLLARLLRELRKETLLSQKIRRHREERACWPGC